VFLVDDELAGKFWATDRSNPEGLSGRACFPGSSFSGGCQVVGMAWVVGSVILELPQK